MKNFKINLGAGDLFIHKIEVSENEEKTVIGPIHHIHILDRSGSMHREINILVDDVLKTFENIPEEDFVSVIWFSSPKNVRVLVKMAKNDETLANIVNGMRSAGGTTCFSDPIKEVRTIVEEMYSVCPNIIVTLFSDGQAVVPWPDEKEHNMCFEDAYAMRDKIIAFNTVGYGSYYDTTLLKTLPTYSDNGWFNHTAEVESYASLYEQNLNIATNTSNKSISINADGCDILHIGNSLVSLSHNTLEKNRISSGDNVFYVIGKEDSDISIKSQDVLAESTPMREEDSDKEGFIVAYAFGLYDSGKRFESLNLLKDNDFNVLAGMQKSAYTRDEIQEYSKAALTAVYDVDTRENYKGIYIEKPSYIDLLFKLSESDAIYHPYLSEEKYQRITRKTDDSFNMFKGDKEKAVGYFNELVFHKNRLNISVKFKVPGFVSINPKAAKNAGLPISVESHIYRNHTFIKDGEVNVKNFVVSFPVGFDISTELRKFPYDNVVTRDGRSYVTFNIDNRYAVTTETENYNVGTLLDVVELEVKAQHAQKILNKIIKDMVETKPSLVKFTDSIFKDYTMEQIQVLEEHGISKSGSYSPVGRSEEKAEELDFYMIRTCEFTLKGFSSVPKVEEVVEVLGDDKAKLTPPKKLMESVFKEMGVTKDIFTEITTNPTAENYRHMLDLQKKYKGYLRDSYKMLAQVKFKVILSGDMFKGVTQDTKTGNYLYERDGKTLVIRMDKVKEYV